MGRAHGSPGPLWLCDPVSRLTGRSLELLGWDQCRSSGRARPHSLSSAPCIPMASPNPAVQTEERCMHIQPDTAPPAKPSPRATTETLQRPFCFPMTCSHSSHPERQKGRDGNSLRSLCHPRSPPLTSPWSFPSCLSHQSVHSHRQSSGQTTLNRQ